MNLHDYYEYDDGLLLNKQTKHIYCNVDKEGYLRIRVEGREYRAHRIIWEMFNGPIPEGMLVDHIDGDTLNNRIENLRLATRRENNINAKATTNRSLPKGVSSNGKKYRVRLTFEGTTLCLGSYHTIEEAKQVYDSKNKELNGEFVRAE